MLVPLKHKAKVDNATEFRSWPTFVVLKKLLAYPAKKKFGNELIFTSGKKQVKAYLDLDIAVFPEGCCSSDRSSISHSVWKSQKSRIQHCERSELTYFTLYAR